MLSQSQLSVKISAFCVDLRRRGDIFAKLEDFVRDWLFLRNSLFLPYCNKFTSSLNVPIILQICTINAGILHLIGFPQLLLQRQRVLRQWSVAKTL